MKSDELKALRLKMGLTQKQFGDLIGISQSAIVKLESGKNKMSRQTEMLIRAIP